MSTVFPRGPKKVFVCSTYVEGKRVANSTGTTDRKTAIKIGEKVQDLTDCLTKDERRSQAKLERLIGAIFDAAGVVSPLDPKSGPQVKFAEFAKRWLDRKQGSTSAVTVRIAKAAVENFSGYIEDRKLAEITGEQVQAWADAMLKSNYAPNTINGRVAVIKAVFRHAQNIGLIRVNPAAAIEIGKGKGVVNRKDLPDSVFQKITAHLAGSTLAHAREWRIAMVIARYAGLRLRDAVRVLRHEFHPYKGILCFTALKTNRLVCVPIFEPLLTFLKEETRHEAAQFEGGYFCPGLADKKANVLSESFERIIAAAGVDNPQTAVASGRAFNQYSFHGLRHAFVTDLARRGIPEHLRMILADHSTKKSHAGYNHAQAQELAAQIAPFFNITKP